MDITNTLKNLRMCIKLKKMFISQKITTVLLFLVLTGFLKKKFFLYFSLILCIFVCFLKQISYSPGWFQHVSETSLELMICLPQSSHMLEWQAYTTLPSWDLDVGMKYSMENL